MSELYEKSLVKLELPLILEQLAACAGSAGGKEGRGGEAGNCEGGAEEVARWGEDVCHDCCCAAALCLQLFCGTLFTAGGPFAKTEAGTCQTTGG